MLKREEKKRTNLRNVGGERERRRGQCTFNDSFEVVNFLDKTLMSMESALSGGAGRC